MKLEHRVTVDAPRAKVWAVLMDLPVAAGCVPGARDIAPDGDGASYRIGRRPTEFIVGDSDVGIEVPLEDGLVWAALHQDAGAADRKRLLDLLEDDRLRQQVRLVAVAGATVESTEVAVGDADVRVVQVAVDDERDAIGVVLAVADRVRRPPHRDEVSRPQERDRFLVVDALARAGLLEDLAHAHATATPVVCTNRSSGTVSSRPPSRQSSRNV